MVKGYKSVIASTFHVSETEIAAIYPEYKSSWSKNNLDDLREVLHYLGMDTSRYFELQPVSQHKNRMGQIVISGRYIGEERLDKEWLRSGFASTTAKDKAKNSPLLDDIYRRKGLTVDAQLAMEYADRYRFVEEDDTEEYLTDIKE